MVEFCPECESMLKKTRRLGTIVYKCSVCGFEAPFEQLSASDDLKIAEYKKKRKELMELKGKTLVLDAQISASNPITDEECPACGHPKAEFYQLQILAGDEPTTTFYRCLKCGMVWRHEV